MTRTTNLTPQQIAADLRRAAKLLSETKGTRWAQGDFHVLLGNKVCHCAEGAIMVVTGYHKNLEAIRTSDTVNYDLGIGPLGDRSIRRNEVVRALEDYLRRHDLGFSVPAWNDADGRTADEVIAAFLAAADDLDPPGDAERTER